MHDHEPEVVGKRVGNEEPLACHVLEPNLRVARAPAVVERLPDWVVETRGLGNV